MRYVLAAALMLGLSAPAMAKDAKPAPTITRSVKVDKFYNNVIIEDIETGCQTIILISGLTMVSIPRLTADGKPWCRNTVPQ